MTFWSNPKWYWVRWILVLPTSIFGVLLASFLAFLIPYFIQEQISLLGDDWSNSLMWKSLVVMADGYWFIALGSKVAPAHKKRTALVLIVLFYLLIGILLFTQIQLRNWGNLIITVISIIGVFTGYMGIEEKEAILED